MKNWLPLVLGCPVERDRTVRLTNIHVKNFIPLGRHTYTSVRHTQVHGTFMLDEKVLVLKFLSVNGLSYRWNNNNTTSQRDLSVASSDGMVEKHRETYHHVH